MDWTCDCGRVNKEAAGFCDQCGAPRPQIQENVPQAGAPALPEKPAPAAPDPIKPEPPRGAPAPPKKRGKGCWLAALAGAAVLVLLIAALAAAVYFYVLPKLKRGARNATEGVKTLSEEAKQAKAMADLQLFAAALRAYRSDVGRLPSPGHTPDSYYSIVDLSTLSGMLCPAYLPSIPMDPWGNPYLYGISYDDKGYVLICTGSDGVNGLQKIPDSPLETSCFEDEMVVEDGAVLQKPGGPQRHCEEAGGQR